MGVNQGLCLVLLVLLFVANVSGHDSLPEISEQVTQRRKTVPLKPYVDPLPQMTKIFGYDKKFGRFVPKTLTIGMFSKKMQTSSPPPSIETIQGVATYVKWENHLPLTHILPVDYSIPVPFTYGRGVPAVVHLHGGVVAPHSDGNAYAWYTADYAERGHAWTQTTYTYPNVQHSGNLMYHDHALGLTRVNLLAGLLGAFVIRNPALGLHLNLPMGDEFDRHLVIADRSFNTDGSIYMNPVGVNPDIHPVWRPEYFGDAITVNGKIWPFLRVNRRKYRFRIINACNARYLDLYFSSGLPFTVIGSDTTYLPSPTNTQRLLLSIAEIFDVVVDFRYVVGTEVKLMNLAPYPYPNGTAPAGNGDSRVMKFMILPNNVPDHSMIPPWIINYGTASPNEAIRIRYISFYEYFSITNQTTHMYINGKRLEDPVTETPKSGTTELWNVINLTDDNHPLHIHLAHMQAHMMYEIGDVEGFKSCMTQKYDAIQCNVNGYFTGNTAPPPAHERTWKNVVKIPPGYMVSVVVKFNMVETNSFYPFDATAFPGYVYHCHILDHEDNAMIRPLNLIP